LKLVLFGFAAEKEEQAETGAGCSNQPHGVTGVRGSAPAETGAGRYQERKTPQKNKHAPRSKEDAIIMLLDGFCQWVFVQWTMAHLIRRDKNTMQI